jgi:hypothetical protein
MCNISCKFGFESGKCAAFLKKYAIYQPLVRDCLVHWLVSELPCHFQLAVFDIFYLSILSGCLWLDVCWFRSVLFLCVAAVSCILIYQ